MSGNSMDWKIGGGGVSATLFELVKIRTAEINLPLLLSVQATSWEGPERPSLRPIYYNVQMHMSNSCASWIQ